MFNLSEKLKTFRLDKGISQEQLSEALNVTVTTISNYETGRREPSFDTLLKILAIFGVSVEEFFSSSSSQRLQSLTTTRIPILSSVSAGLGNFGEEDPIDWLELPKSIAKNADYASFVTGDSMEPKIYQGDLLLIEKTDILDNGDIGIFRIGSEVVCKKFKANPLIKEINLVSFNPKYKPILIDKSYCQNNDFNILGRVVGKLDYDF